MTAAREDWDSDTDPLHVLAVMTLVWVILWSACCVAVWQLWLLAARVVS